MNDRPAAPVPEQAVTAAADEHDEKWHASVVTARQALEAAAPAIREAERQRMFGNGDPEQYHGLIKLTRADAAIAERERWLAVLADHYLAGIEWDPDRKLDNPVCGCSRVFLGWHPSIGAARQAWIDHVKEIVSVPTGDSEQAIREAEIKADPYVTGLRDGAADLRARVAELERLAADMLSRFTKTDAYRARVGQVQIAKWEAILKGTP